MSKRSWRCIHCGQPVPQGAKVCEYCEGFDMDFEIDKEAMLATADIPFDQMSAADLPSFKVPRGGVG